MQAWRVQKRRWMARDRRTTWANAPVKLEDWGAWLGGFPWDWFVTLTFPDVIGHEAAARTHIRWTRALEKHEGHQVRQARGLEYQQRGVIHYHALLWGVRPDTRRLDWMDAWHTISGGFARIVQYDPTRGAAHYVAKYVTKGGEVDLLGPWWHGRGHDADPREPPRREANEHARPDRG